MVGGNEGCLKKGDINPLTGDKLIEHGKELISDSTA